MVIKMKGKRGVVFNVGINDADYKIQNFIGGKYVKCPFYVAWSEMIRRCYDPKWVARRQNYAGCKVCDEWLTFSNFKKWMEQQDWKGKALDKDIIKQGNKIYCPEFCAMVCSLTNNFVTDRVNHRGIWPLGVYKYMENVKNPFASQCRDPFTKQRHRIGYYSTPEEAHMHYMSWKHNVALDVAEIQTDQRVANALRTRYLSTHPMS